MARLAEGPVGGAAYAGVDRIRTMAFYSIALQLAVFGRKRVQSYLDEVSQTNGSIGGPPLPCSTS
ncbi:hypothetical protein [Streptomyces poonensis]|uniref:hypothetical protein n=1 Tax=Streptomyces poonensis TaxID=68255 RepID=UPI001673BFB0|nr:hypothetical protein [Streptomyces poonensis]